jgi:hypothetical protein
MAKLDDSTRQIIQAALHGKRGDEAKTAIADLAATLHVSRGYLYRLSQAVRNPARARRRDAGQGRIVVTPEVSAFMEALTYRGDLAANTVLFATARHFGLPEDFMSEATYNLWLRRGRLSRADLQHDLRPARRFEAAKPNDLHHFDTTVAESYYRNDDLSIGYEPTAKRNKNKPGNRRARVILYAGIDDHSRVLFARFYMSDNTLNLLDFLRRAWTQKDDKRFPFYGLPTEVYCDLGPSNVSGLFTDALAKLGVTRLSTTPSNSARFGSRKHGKVERTFGEGLLGEFMKFTKFYKFASLEEMNATLWEWLIHLNNRRHSMTKEKRFTRWLQNVGTPRSAPSAVLWAQLTYRRKECTVNPYLCILINGKQFQLPQRHPYSGWVGAKVEVYWHPEHEETIRVVYDYHEEELQACAPVIDLAGAYKSIAQTEQAKRVEELDQVDLRALNLPDLYKTDLPYLPKKGAQFDASKIATKVVEQPDGTKRPSFAQMRYLNRFQVAAEISHAFTTRETRNEFLGVLMAGRESISDDELTTALRAYQQRTGTEG